MASPDGMQNNTGVNSQADGECKRLSPVPGGIAVGVIMLLTYYTAGRGYGTTGGLTHLRALFQSWLLPELTAKSQHLQGYLNGRGYLTYMLAGTVIGSFLGALTGNDLRVKVLRGPNISAAVSA